MFQDLKRCHSFDIHKPYEKTDRFINLAKLLNKKEYDIINTANNSFTNSQIVKDIIKARLNSFS